MPRAPGGRHAGPALLFVLAALAGGVAGCSSGGGDELVFRRAASGPLARFESAAAVAGGRLYLFGGHAGSDLAATREVFSYDPADDSWTRHADLPAPVTHVNAVVEGDRFVWLAGGYEGDHPGRAVDDVRRYDVVEDRWETPAPDLPALRASGGLALVDDALHYFGGLGEDRFTNYPDHWALSLSTPGADWEPRAPMPQPRAHFGTAVLDGRIYAIGGHFHHDDPPDDKPYDYADQAWVHRYDPAADAWEEVAALPERRSHTDPGTVAYGGRLLIVAGRNNSPGWMTRIARGFDTRIRGLDDISAYDPADDRWKRIGRLPRELYAPAAGVVGKQLVVVGGGRDGWRDPGDETWVAELP